MNYVSFTQNTAAPEPPMELGPSPSATAGPAHGEEVSYQQLESLVHFHLWVHPDLETDLIQVLWGLRNLHILGTRLKKNSTKISLTTTVHTTEHTASVLEGLV